MEHVINAKLRNQAFWKFLIFFLVTTAIIVTAVYFDMDIPKDENASLRAQIKNYEDQAFIEQQFLMRADSVKSLLDSLGSSKDNYEFNNTLIEQALANMKIMTNSLDSSNIYTDINKRFLFSFVSLKEKHRLVKDASEKIEDMSKQLKEYEDKGRNNDNAQLFGKNNSF